MSLREWIHLVSMTIIFFVTAMVLVAILFYLVIYAFVMDLNVVKEIIINAITLSMSRKHRNEFTKEYYRLLNMFLKDTATEIVQTSDKELAIDLVIDDIAKIKLFKKTLTDVMNDENREFVSYDDVKAYLREQKTFNFINQIYFLLHSNPQILREVNGKSLSSLASLVVSEHVEENRVDNFQKMYNAIA